MTQRNLTIEEYAKEFEKLQIKCEGLGHIALDCPNQRIITLAEWNAIREEDNEEEQKENEEDEQEGELEEVEEAANGEMIVLRRLLSNQRGIKDAQ